MERNEAFELLEAHAGPRASLSIHEEANRYYIDCDGKRANQTAEWIIFVGIGDAMYSWHRETLSEAVAAALANVPKYRKEGE